MTSTATDWPTVSDTDLRLMLTDLDLEVVEQAREEQSRRVRSAGGSPVLFSRRVRGIVRNLNH